MTHIWTQRISLDKIKQVFPYVLAFLLVFPAYSFVLVNAIIYIRDSTVGQPWTILAFIVITAIACMLGFGLTLPTLIIGESRSTTIVLYHLMMRFYWVLGTTLLTSAWIWFMLFAFAAD